MEKAILKPFWRSFLTYNWKFGILLILLFGIPRFIIVLQANISGSYGWVSIIFMLMWITPFILLNKDGRRYIGIKKPQNYRWLLYSFLIGIAFCSFMFTSANLLFGDSLNNSFIYISKSYTLPVGELTATNKLILFLTFSLTGMTFSPIGEEFLYRGLIHGSFVEKYGEQKASIFDSLAFALTHLAHFGIIYNLGKWDFLFIPALLWVLGMFILSQLFFRCKQMTGSIWGAVVSHAGYNFGMMYWIFYHIF